MIAFIILCEALTVLALAWVLRPLWRTQMVNGTSDLRAANTTQGTVTIDEQARLAVYRDRRLEIASELELGRLSAEEAQKQQEDLVQEVAREFGETEIVRRSPVNRKSALALGVLGAALAALIYMTVGMPHLVENLPTQAAQAEGQDPAKLIAELEEKVAKDPKDAQSWAFLGAAYKYTGLVSKSVSAFEKYFALEPPTKKESARPLAEFAEVLALSKDSNFSGRPIELLHQALKLDPTEPKSLAMMGAAQFRSGNLPEAKRYLSQLLTQMPPDSPQAAQLKPLVERIDEQLKNPSAAAPLPAESKSAEISSQKPEVPAKASADPAAINPSASAIITGRLLLAPNAKTADALRDVKAIFVSVKSAPAEAGPTTPGDGGAVLRAMPVAALKIDQNFTADRWPLSFSLSNEQSLRPQAPLSKAGEVVLEVHLSKSGLPGKNSGDWFGKIGPFRPDANVLEVKVDQQLP